MNYTKVHTKEEVLSAITTNSDRIKSYGVDRLGIFGSFSKGTFTEASDVDFLVEFYPDKKSFDNFIDLSFFLENLLGRKVEIITTQSLSKFIGPHILKEVENVRL
jgi:predicted nucleotidyltransferase